MDGCPELVFLKLGGSLLTDKTRPQALRPMSWRGWPAELAEALAARPELRLLLGHGSGSFGHVTARQHGTRDGVRTAEQWRGYAEVSHVASELNRLVVDALWEAGVPALARPALRLGAVPRRGTAISGRASNSCGTGEWAGSRRARRREPRRGARRHDHLDRGDLRLPRAAACVRRASCSWARSTAS